MDTVKLTLDADATQAYKAVATAVVEASQQGQPVEASVIMDGKVTKVFMWTAVAAVARAADEAAKCAAGIVAQVIEDTEVQAFLAEFQDEQAGSSSIEENAKSGLQVRHSK